MKLRKIIGIYKIISPTNKIYVGQSINIKRRFNEYLKLKCESQPKLYNSLKKYGPENHKFEIIEECELEQLNEREIYWGNLFEVLDLEKGLNTRFLGGQGKQSSEIVEKIAKKTRKSIFQYDLKGNFIKEWSCAVEAIKELGLGNSNNINDCARGKYRTTYGYIWEYKENKRTNVEREEFIKSLEHRSNLGSKLSEEIKQKISNNTKGIKKHSEEFKQKLRKDKEGNQYGNKKINVFDENMNFIKTCISRKEATEYTKLTYADVRYCLLYNLTVKNFNLKYK